MFVSRNKLMSNDHVIYSIKYSVSILIWYVLLGVVWTWWSVVIMRSVFFRILTTDTYSYEESFVSLKSDLWSAPFNAVVHAISCLSNCPNDFIDKKAVSTTTFWSVVIICKSWNHSSFMLIWKKALLDKRKTFLPSASADCLNIAK